MTRKPGYIDGVRMTRPASPPVPMGGGKLKTGYKVSTPTAMLRSDSPPNDGAWMIRAGFGYMQRDLPSPRVDTVATFGAKSTARRFLTRDKAERFILDVLGHSHDYRVVHLLPRGTIARRERRTVAEAVKRVAQDVHGPMRFCLDRLVEELS